MLYRGIDEGLGVPLIARIKQDVVPQRLGREQIPSKATFTALRLVCLTRSSKAVDMILKCIADQPQMVAIIVVQEIARYAFPLTWA